MKNLKTIINKVFFGLSLLQIFSLQAWPPALKNCGNTCFLNATLQAMYTIDPLSDIFFKAKNPYDESTTPVGYYYVELVKKIEQTKNPRKPESFTCASDQVLYKLDHSAYNLMEAQACSQQDATEFMGKFLDTLIENGGILKIPIKNIFKFDLISTVVCPALLESTDAREHSKLVRATKDKDHTYLFVETQNRQKQPLKSLKQCLEEYFTIEKIDAYQDARTGKNRIDCTKQFQLSNSPEIFIIGLKRYEALDLFGSTRKLDHRIYIPLQLNVANFVVEDNRNPLANHFELIAIVVQGGGVAGGHYWTYVKDEMGQWFMCDDLKFPSIEKVEISDRSVVNQIEGSPNGPTGYGFVYQKKSITQGPFNKWQKEEKQRENKALGIDPLGDLKNELDKLTDLLQNLAGKL